jgi:hypothetical protein
MKIISLRIGFVVVSSTCAERRIFVTGVPRMA